MKITRFMVGVRIERSNGEIVIGHALTVYAIADSTDEQILAWCNREVPSPYGPWNTVDRIGTDDILVSL